MPTLADIAGAITPIIDTFRAPALATERDLVLARYLPNADRYFPQDAIKRARQSLVSRLKDGKRTLGFLQAPYGYGKTAAAIYLWSELQKENTCAVPPFQFTSLDAIAEAVAGWLGSSLADRDATHQQTLNELYKNYRTVNVEQHAEQIARQYRVELEAARRIVSGEIAGKVALGRAAHLADFLVACANLAQKAGFTSLCVFCDEMQIFIDGGDTRENVEAFRQLVLALRGETAPLGLMFIVHERHGMVLEEQAGDAMQRLKDDGAGINLGQYKQETFPRDLLVHLCRQTGEKVEQVADDATLAALGQIALREDLSNGPRTVAAAIRAIGRYRAETGETYRVPDLARDYETGAIVFDGANRSLAGTLAQLIADPVVRTEKRFTDVIRFLALFPSGAPETFLLEYDLHAPLLELAQERGLLATVIYSPRRGYWGLVALQEKAGAGDLITQVVKQFLDNFWYRQSETGRVSAAHQAFARLLLPELFPRRAQGDAGRKFGGHLKMSDTWGGRDVNEIMLNGSFETTQTRYPDRHVAVAVGANEDKISGYRPTNDDAHLWFTFRLDTLGEGVPHRVETANCDPRLAFSLNLDVRIGDDYPAELNLLQDSIVPRLCNACILLNLMLYVQEKVLSGGAFPEAEREHIAEYLYRSPLRRIEQMLLSAEGMEAVGIAVRGRGRQLLEAAFETKLAECFPDYKALLTGAESTTDLTRYEKLLKDGGFILPVKRGQKPVLISNNDFVAKTGASAASAYDALVSRLKRLHLLADEKADSVNGVRYASLTLREHPLELLLRCEIETRGVDVSVTRAGRTTQTKRMERDALLRLAQRHGYSRTECETAFQLATWRQWLEIADAHVLIAVPSDDPDVLRREADIIRERIGAYRSTDEIGAHDLEVHHELLQQRLDVANPDDLSEIGLELRLLNEKIVERLRAATRILHTDIERLRGTVSDAARRVPLSDLSKPLTLASAVGAVLENARKKLQKHLETQKNSLEQIGSQLAAMENTLKQAGNTETLLRLRTELADHDATQARISKQITATINAHRHLERWLVLGTIAERLTSDLEGRDADLGRRLSDWVDRIVEAGRGISTDLQGFLASHTEFSPALDAISAEFRASEQKRRGEYEAFVKQIGDLFIAEKLPIPRAVPYDAHNEADSYESVARDVSKQLKDALYRLLPELQDLSAHATFLSEFRARDVGKWQKELETLRTQVENAATQITPEVVAQYRDGYGNLPMIAGTHRAIAGERARIATALGEQEKADPPKPGLEQEVLLAVKNTAQYQNAPLTLGELFRTLRKERTVSATELFEALEALYTQGNAEIVIRSRSKGSGNQM